MEQNFELIKMQLLLRCLEETHTAEFHAALIHEAELATRLACLTGFPELVFPCLFEERARAVLEEQARAETRYWGALESVVSETVAELTP